MQPPLPIGTVLQNRYRLAKILGQGGFGRTYLAEDQGRFREQCALKELIPPQTNAYPLEKTKELFQREAAILYQLQHPQIPQFRATFEQDGRLFLVQDYVEGKTYRLLLAERKSSGQRFSEAEVLQLLDQLLPVLNHIHSKGIIHRDISPDNLILRERDNLPVLIDFGVVKELASRFQYPDRVPSTTMVGKLGYAPSEQIQTGRAYASSDLYSLAVTSVVLLTGQEPQVLFDESSLNWNWYRWIPPIHPGLTLVLNRMLSYRPGDRYQDAREVARALNDALNYQPQAAPPPQIKASPTPKISQVQTLAVSGRSPEPLPEVRQSIPRKETASEKTSVSPHKADPVIIPAPGSSLDNPWIVALIGMSLAILAGVGSWTLVSYLLQRQVVLPNATTTQPLPRTEPTVVFPDTKEPLPINLEPPTPTASAEPITYSQRLDIVENQLSSTSDKLKANATVNYIFTGKQGQKLTASLQEEGVLMTILGPNEEPIDNKSKRVTRWDGQLPFDGNYVVQLSTVRGVTESNYKLDLLLSNAPPTPTETPTETPTPTNENSTSSNLVIDTQPVDFPEGATGTQIFAGETSPENIKRFLVNVQSGQILSVRIQNGEATLDIRHPNGILVESASGVGEWESTVDEDGEYQIDVKSTNKTNFSVDISVR